MVFSSKSWSTSEAVIQQTFFDAPSGDDPVALDLSSMGKGQAWVNGQSIGRFWPSYVVPANSCSNGCDYRGLFNSTKCVSNCGQPSQRWWVDVTARNSYPFFLAFQVSHWASSFCLINLIITYTYPMLRDTCKHVLAHMLLCLVFDAYIHVLGVHILLCLFFDTYMSLAHDCFYSFLTHTYRSFLLMLGGGVSVNLQCLTSFLLDITWSKVAHIHECDEDISLCRYHVPRSWLKPKENLLVLFEEVGGDPSSISVVVRVVDKICGYIAEDYPPPLSKWSWGLANVSFPQLSLECGKGQTISSINFSSFGTPTGQCGNFQRGLCHAPESLQVLERVRITCFIIESSNAKCGLCESLVHW